MSKSAKYGLDPHEQLKRSLDYRRAEESKTGKIDWSQVFDQWRAHLKGAGE